MDEVLSKKPTLVLVHKASKDYACLTEDGTHNRDSAKLNVPMLNIVFLTDPILLL